jgi:hypothetical protein
LATFIGGTTPLELVQEHFRREQMHPRHRLLIVPINSTVIAFSFNATTRELDAQYDDIKNSSEIGIRIPA